MAEAYAGVRVLDFTQGVPGPMAGALFADYGAEVFKIEGRDGDWYADQPGYHGLNRGKTRIVIDLETPAGLAAARDLIASADVALFCNAPGDLERLRLDAAACLALNPALIHAWTPPYGTEGRWSQLPPDHTLLAALTGISFRQASSADQPVQHVTPLIWYAQGIMAASAIGAALIERQTSGAGQAVVVSGIHGAAEVSTPVAGPNRRTTGPGYPQGASAAFKLYECGDGKWLFLGTLFSHFFVQALEMTGVMPILKAEAGEGVGSFGGAVPPAPPGRIRELLQAAFASKTRAEWMQILVDNDVPVGAVGRREEWFASETVRANGMRYEAHHPGLGVIAMPAAPLALSGTPGAPRGLLRDLPAGDVPFRPAPQSRGPARPGDGPLAGVKVLDLGTVIAGAYGGHILASYGADVVKIEPAEGDSFRSTNVGFGAYNRDKRGLGVDLKGEAGRALLLDLARNADVLLENYRAGVRDRLGLSDAELWAVNPRLVTCTITAYGKGPFALLPGFDPVLQAEGGIMAAQGGDGPPVQHTLNVNDVGSSALAAFGVVTALHARGITGQGQAVVASLANTAVALQWAENTTWPGSPPYEVGGHDCLGVSALRRFYRCADGWIALAVRRTEDASALAATLGLDVSPQASLVALRDGPLADQISAALSGLSQSAALETLLAAGVPCAPAVRGDATWDDPWLWANSYFEHYQHPHVGDTIGSPGYAVFSRTHHNQRRPVPGIGEHSTEVLREYGIAAERVADLTERGVVFGG